MAETIAPRWATGPLTLPEAQEVMGQIISTPESLKSPIVVQELNNLEGYKQMTRDQKLTKLIEFTTKGSSNNCPTVTICPPSDIDRRVLSYGYFGTTEKAVSTLTENFYQIVDRVLYLRGRYGVDFLFCTVLCGGPTLNPKFAQAGLEMAQHLIDQKVNFYTAVGFPPTRRSLFSPVDPATLARTYINNFYPQEVLEHIIGVSSNPGEITSRFSRVIDDWVAQIGP